jgi:cytochrome c-type biogenesis protein CcmH
MTVVAALIVVRPLVRRRAAPMAGVGEIAVYADQLAEIGRDFDAGLIGESEQAAARTEISRRILRADQATKAAPTAGRGRARLVAGILAVIAIPAISLGLYLDLGSPRLPDEPLADRKAEPLDQMSPDDLIARLDQQLAANPNDIRGWDIAGPIYLRMGRYQDAVAAFQTAIRLGGTDLKRQSGLGEALTANAQGIVTSDARVAFEAALKLDPAFPLPKMYLALALSQDGKLQESVDAWKALIASAKGNPPWVSAAQKELEGVEARLAGETGQPAPAGAQPAIDPAAKSMIEGMVARLQGRLETEGGSAEEWGRLIKSYMVLGRSDDAKATYTKAKASLSANSTAMAELASIVDTLGLPQ